MTDLIFDPYAAYLYFSNPVDRDLTEWGSMIAELMETLARKCIETGPCVIGHIKGFAQLPGSGYLKISVVSPDYPADIAGDLDGRSSELLLTLNVLVYGHGRETLASLTKNVVDARGKSWSGGVRIEPVTIASEPRDGCDDHHGHRHE